MIKKVTNHNNILVLLLGLVIISMPLKSSINSNFILLLSGYIFFCLFKKRHQLNNKLSKNILILIIPFFFILLQGFYSEWNSFIRNAIRSLPLILFPFLFYYITQWTKKKHTKLVLKILVYSAVLYSLFLLIVAFYRQFQHPNSFSNINWYYFTYYDFTDALSVHPTYLGMYLCLAFSISYNQFLLKRTLDIKNTFTCVFLSIIIFLLGSRIALTCLILIILSLIFFYFKKIELLKKTVLLAIIIMTPLLVFNFVPIVKERMIDMTFGLKETYEYANYGDKGKNNNYNGGLTPRLIIWNCAINVGNFSFLGSGFGKTQKRLNDCYSNNGYKSFSDKNYQTHNQYFNNYARGGLIGLMLLLLVYIYSLFYALKKKNVLHYSLMIIVIVTSLTENILNLHLGIVYFTFFNSLFFFTE